MCYIMYNAAKYNAFSKKRTHRLMILLQDEMDDAR